VQNLFQVLAELLYVAIFAVVAIQAHACSPCSGRSGPLLAISNWLLAIGF